MANGTKVGGLYASLDRGLTVVLMVLVAAMVLSVTLEIVLTAALQPILSHMLDSLAEGGNSSGTLAAWLQWGLDAVGASSAPVSTASQTLLIWVAILGSALAFRQRAHLGVDAFVRYYPYRVRVFLDYGVTVLVGLFSLFVLVIGGYLVCRNAFVTGSKMPGLQAVNRGWFYLVLVIAGGLNLLYCVGFLIHPQPVTTSLEGEQAGEGEET